MDSFVLIFSEGNVGDKHMDLSKLDIHIKTNNEVPAKIKLEFESKSKEELIAPLSNTYSFKNFNAKEKGTKRCNNAKHEQHYNAFM